MSIRTRIARGAEAGAITAAAVEVSFFVLDLVRLTPLATPATLSGAPISPAGVALDITSVSGAIEALWVGYQISVLTVAHFAAFALAGIFASFAFDWSRAGGMERYGVVAVLSALALVCTVFFSSSVGTLGAIDPWMVIGMLLVAPAILGAVLRVLSMPQPGEEGA